ALASGKARYAGEAVAVAGAESRYAAEDALDRIAVEYAPLAAATDPRTAMADGSLLVHDNAPSNVILSRAFSQGDVDAALRGSAARVAARFRFQRHAAVAIENRACLAEWDAGMESLTLWTSTQVPGMLREALAELLRIPAHRVRVVAP